MLESACMGDPLLSFGPISGADKFVTLEMDAIPEFGAAFDAIPEISGTIDSGINQE